MHKLRFQCSEGRQWDRWLQSIIKGSWCPECRKTKIKNKCLKNSSLISKKKITNYSKKINNNKNKIKYYSKKNNKYRNKNNNKKKKTKYYKINQNNKKNK